MTEQTILQEEQDVVANNIIHAECKGNYTYNDINYISIAKYNKSSKLMKFITCSDDNISIDSLRMKWTRKYQLIPHQQTYTYVLFRDHQCAWSSLCTSCASWTNWVI